MTNTTSKTIAKDVVDSAKQLLDQGKTREAWQALADGGDNYAWNAVRITNTTGSSFTQTLVRNHWDETVGQETYDQKFEAVAKQHLAD
ncbi:hypothetical protein HEQ72_10880 [Haematospirillum sp. 15-248]|uniref:hypothetical protein n=1 Tax=Haematospirillum sp. 15-248 TaxID=2723107 RepID=UPI00143C3E25|nr:hypothetical protein [Haematospirillum sp. 15-248]NKD88803.1 hypothetical protein [Haematospirillum sp. 15-248]